jgi:hypothetical protein
MSARPYRAPTRQAANEPDSGATPFFLAVICLLVGMLAGSVIAMRWDWILEWFA